MQLEASPLNLLARSPPPSPGHRSCFSHLLQVRAQHSGNRLLVGAGSLLPNAAPLRRICDRLFAMFRPLNRDRVKLYQKPLAKNSILQ